MDEYQLNIMEDSGFALYGKCFSPQGDINSFNVIVDNSYTITLCQHENITFLNYMLYIQYKSAVDSIFALRASNQIELRKENNEMSLPIDFNEPFESLKIVFKNNLVDDIIIPLVYKLADKNAYYARMNEERRAELLKNANIKISTGADLVNIYFQPCDTAYKRTVIELYKATGKYETRHISSGVIIPGVKYPSAKLLGGTIDMLIGQFKVEEGMFFRSIAGLAYGVYAIKLIQFDENDKELLKSDALLFEISNDDDNSKFDEFAVVIG